MEGDVMSQVERNNEVHSYHYRLVAMYRGTSNNIILASQNLELAPVSLRVANVKNNIIPLQAV